MLHDDELPDLARREQADGLVAEARGQDAVRGAGRCPAQGVSEDDGAAREKNQCCAA